MSAYLRVAPRRPLGVRIRSRLLTEYTLAGVGLILMLALGLGLTTGVLR